MKTSVTPATSPSRQQNHLRFHAPHGHLTPTFGDSWFGAKAEAFARFFGTPTFLISQTTVVAAWIGINVATVTNFDPYPFILLNLAFSLQAAYAAPLILLAQTRQAERDKVHADADALHREDLAKASVERHELATVQARQIIQLLEQNTQLTKATEELSERIETLTHQIHERVVSDAKSP